MSAPETMLVVMTVGHAAQLHFDASLTEVQRTRASELVKVAESTATGPRPGHLFIKHRPGVLASYRQGTIWLDWARLDALTAANQPPMADAVFAGVFVHEFGHHADLYPFGKLPSDLPVWDRGEIVADMVAGCFLQRREVGESWVEPLVDVLVRAEIEQGNCVASEHESCRTRRRKTVQRGARLCAGSAKNLFEELGWT